MDFCFRNQTKSILMKTLYLFLIFILTSILSIAQTTVNGIVTDTKNNPIAGANVYIEGTYDGGSTDDKGAFSFTTSSENVQSLVISFLSFETYTLTLDVSKMKDLNIRLKDDVNALDSVILTAGSFAAGDNSKASVLKPLDIVTTAGAAGDFIAAFQTLPGTSTVGEDGRLFVRGGDANETNIYIDNLSVFQPFSPTANNLPTRGRFSSFLFRGMNFSTGGYAAEYGNALSSVLLLNTIHEPEEKTDLQFINVGLGAGHTKKWNKSSLSINSFYLNLKPYQNIVHQRVDWIKPYESLSGESVYRYHFNKGTLKVYGGLSYSNFKLNQEDINVPEGIYFGLKNRNLYINSSYQGDLSHDWQIHAGASYANDDSSIEIIETDVKDQVHNAHLKVKLKKRFSNRFKFSLGAEYFINSFHEMATDPSFDAFITDYQNNSTAAFAEANVFFSKNLALQTGLRATHNYLLEETHLSPRLALAYKIAPKSQLSLAYGDFYQTPNSQVLKYDTALSSEKATHYILNYLYQKDRRTFRAEIYYKDYDNLIKYNTEQPEFNSLYNNTGEGYATGLDLYWRDNKTFKNFEYWASYSYLDTQRNYRNYPQKATPNFASKHNASFVGKYFVSDWKSLLGFSYNIASGRPYTNPNTTAFQGAKTKTYHSLNLNWAYLISQQKIVYVSVSNVLGTKNIFNYQYANSPNTQGVFNRRAIEPAADRFFIVGFFWTISDNKKDNQLDNL